MMLMEHGLRIFAGGFVLHGDGRRRYLSKDGVEEIEKREVGRGRRRGVKAFSEASRKRLELIAASAANEFRSLLTLTYHARAEAWEDDATRNGRIVARSKARLESVPDDDASGAGRVSLGPGIPGPGRRALPRALRRRGVGGAGRPVLVSSHRGVGRRGRTQARHKGRPRREPEFREVVSGAVHRQGPPEAASGRGGGRLAPVTGGAHQSQSDARARVASGQATRG